MEYPKFKVTVSCMTYNQSKYITDAMNGFTMQQTSFPFVCTIVDDASTDGEQEVIRKYVEDNFDFSEGSVAYHKETDYAHITYAQHKTNKNCYFAVLYLEENHCSKHKDKSPYLKDWRDGVEYMAICEGDDYWIVPDKLEKQYDYMKSHNGCALVHTAFKFYTEHDHKFHNSEKDQKIYNLCKQENKNIACEIISFNYRVVTASSFFRYDYYIKITNDIYYNKYYFMLGDIQLWTMLLQYGEIGYLPDVATIYRVHAGSACRQVNMKSDARMSLSISEMQMHFLPKVKGSEYLRSEFCRRFKKSLFKYRLFDPNYQSFIIDKECRLNKLLSACLAIDMFRYFVICGIIIKRKLFANSVVKIKSM